MSTLVLHVCAMGAHGELAGGPALFDTARGKLRNAQAVALRAHAEGAVEHMALRRAAGGPLLLSFAPGRQLYVRREDTINFSPGALSLESGEGGTQIFFGPLLAPAGPDTLADILAASPEATPQQIWDAAFMAGVNITTTLLGGTRE